MPQQVLLSMPQKVLTWSLLFVLGVHASNASTDSEAVADTQKFLGRSGRRLLECPDKEMVCINRAPAQSLGMCREHWWLPGSCWACDVGLPERFMNECPLTDFQRSRQGGCSGNLDEGGFSEEYQKIFKAACNLHDSCYSTCGMDKSACDDEFFINLNALCQTQRSNSCFMEVYVMKDLFDQSVAPANSYDLGQEAAGCR